MKWSSRGASGLLRKLEQVYDGEWSSRGASEVSRMLEQVSGGVVWL